MILSTGYMILHGWVYKYVIQNWYYSFSYDLNVTASFSRQCKESLGITFINMLSGENNNDLSNDSPPRSME